jgi:glucokinase
MGILLADIGGTNSRCAVGSAQGRIEDLATFRNAAHAGVAELLSGFLTRLPRSRRPESAALAIAAPIRGDEVSMINISWRFSCRELQHRLGLAELHVLNDFAALAYALPVLAPDEVIPVGGDTPVAGGTKVVLGPGTGLGVASLVSVEGRWHAIPGEGGHVTLPAQDEQEESLVRRAREHYGHCSAERLLSGPGLSFLHETLHGAPALGPEAIGERFLAGDQQAARTAAVFFRLLGTVAGDLALTLGAFGGVYIGGGIVRRYRDALRDSGFRARFEAKGRYKDYMRAIPTQVITAEYPALKGLLAYASAPGRHRA